MKARRVIAAFLQTGTSTILCLALGCAAPRLDALHGSPNIQVNTGGSGRVITPVNQVLTPAGTQVELPGLRPQVIALSPDGSVLATSGKTHELLLVNPQTGAIVERLALPGEASSKAEEAVSTHILQPDTKGQVS